MEGDRGAFGGKTPEAGRKHRGARATCSTCVSRSEIRRGDWARQGKGCTGEGERELRANHRKARARASGEPAKRTVARQHECSLPSPPSCIPPNAYFFRFISLPQQIRSHTSTQPHTSSTVTTNPHTEQVSLSFFFTCLVVAGFFAAVAFLTTAFLVTAFLGATLAVFFVATSPHLLSSEVLCPLWSYPARTLHYTRVLSTNATQQERGLLLSVVIAAYQCLVLAQSGNRSPAPNVFFLG